MCPVHIFIAFIGTDIAVKILGRCKSSCRFFAIFFITL